VLACREANRRLDLEFENDWKALLGVLYLPASIVLLSQPGSGALILIYALGLLLLLSGLVRIQLGCFLPGTRLDHAPVGFVRRPGGPLHPDGFPESDALEPCLSSEHRPRGVG
jgi:hypothetical protein